MPLFSVVSLCIPPVAILVDFFLHHITNIANTHTTNKIAHTRAHGYIEIETYKENEDMTYRGKPHSKQCRNIRAEFVSGTFAKHRGATLINCGRVFFVSAFLIGTARRICTYLS
jgi:hypothetical protein